MKIFCITLISFLESVRQRIVVFMIIIGILFLFAGKGCSPGEIRGKDLILGTDTLGTVSMQAAFHGIAFLSTLLCCFIASGTIIRDCEDGTAVLTLSKPLRRSEFVTGKIIAAVLVSVLSLVLTGAVFCLLFYAEYNVIPVRIILSFLLILPNIMLAACSAAMLSLVVHKYIAQLVTFLLYLISMCVSLPFTFEKIRFIWEPSDTLRHLHSFLPAFGNVQYCAASCISNAVSVPAVLVTFVNPALFCIVLWTASVEIFKRRDL